MRFRSGSGSIISVIIAAIVARTAEAKVCIAQSITKLKQLPELIQINIVCDSKYQNCYENTHGCVPVS